MLPKNQLNRKRKRQAVAIQNLVNRKKKKKEEKKAAYFYELSVLDESGKFQSFTKVKTKKDRSSRGRKRKL